MQITSTILLILTICGSHESAVEKKEIRADVLKVEYSKTGNSYQFSVTLKSADTGCDQYADWWEVLSEDGQLIYRRILQHSHVQEQPFTRSGGPVKIKANQVVWIRAHMNNVGYVGKVMKGSVSTGFSQVDVPDGFAKDVEKANPQPDGCRF